MTIIKSNRGQNNCRDQKNKLRGKNTETRKFTSNPSRRPFSAVRLVPAPLAGKESKTWAQKWCCRRCTGAHQSSSLPYEARRPHVSPGR